MVNSILSSLAPLWLPAALLAQYQAGNLTRPILEEKKKGNSAS